MSSPNVVIMAHYYPNEERVSSNPAFKDTLGKREYYSSNKSNGDYINYIDRGIKAGEVSDYMDYAGNREKSSGVFSTNGILTEEQKSEVREKLRKTKSVIWDMVISFEEAFGKEKIHFYEDALELINKEFPAFLKENRMNIDNVIWFAGLHENTDNRHIHLSFFEKEPQRIVANKSERDFHYGKLSKISLENFKVHLEQRMTSKEYDLTSYRRRLMDDMDDGLNNLSDYAIYSKTLKKKLLELYRILPKGTFGYNNKEMDEARPFIKDIIVFMLNSNPDMQKEYFSLLSALVKKDDDTKAICERNNVEPERFLIADKFVEDFYRRCGNKIIKYVKDVKYEEYEAVRAMNHAVLERRIEKMKRSRLFKESIRLARQVDYEAINCFEEYQARMAKAEYERLIEEGVIEVK